MKSWPLAGVLVGTVIFGVVLALYGVRFDAYIPGAMWGSFSATWATYANREWLFSERHSAQERGEQ